MNEVCKEVELTVSYRKKSWFSSINKARLDETGTLMLNEKKRKRIYFSFIFNGQLVVSFAS